MNRQTPIYVAGHRGLVGSAIVRQLRAQGYLNLLLRTSAELDLCRQQAVEAFFDTHRPEIVYLAAARVGGILANSLRPAEFIAENLAIQTNVIESARKFGTRKLVFLGSSCIYPRLAPQPMKEEYLLTGPLEPTNEWYAIAKIAGIKMCQAYRRQYGFDAISIMPANLYGPFDNFSESESHVLPALIRRFDDAKMAACPNVTLWGSGMPRREFLHVDDCANAVCFLAETYSEERPINVGCGADITILELAQLVRDVVGYKGELNCDGTKPDGTPQKLLDISRLTEFGWSAKIGLREGIQQTYDWFKRFRAVARV